MNGGLWCSPVANTSRPTSSAFFAIATVALMRSCSLGLRPVVGSVVTSPTEKIPICIADLDEEVVGLPHHRIDDVSLTFSPTVGDVSTISGGPVGEGESRPC